MHATTPSSHTNGSDCMQGVLYISVTYVPCDFDQVNDPVVPNVYFNAHPGNVVRFYSCAHSKAEMVPPVEITPGGDVFNVHSCWSDVYDAITSAQKFVFLTGWSFHPLIPLVRDDPAKCKPLGELLKEATDRCCEVCTCRLSVFASFEQNFATQIAPQLCALLCARNRICCSLGPHSNATATRNLI
jgi:hypothetical protein